MPDAARLNPSAESFGEHAPAVEETHISILVLVGDRVLKLKKPLQLPFLDWRDREARRAVCHREVELNRRLSPDVYLGVVDLVGADGTPLDHMVVMRRMPDDRRLSRLVLDGVDVEPALDAVAALIASFHASAERSAAIVEAAGRDAVRRNWDDNIATLETFVGEVVDASVVHRVARRARRYLAGRGALFAERARAGCAVDGHGDLLADDIYLLDDGPRVLDCLEFSDRLRAVDVLDDVAFLAMDLERLGVPRAAAAFLEAYARHSGDTHPASLVDHYIAYRAGVRAKVACLRARQDVPAAAGEARLLLDIADRHLDRARVRLVLVGGLPGTGKSTVAEGIAARGQWHVLRSDVTRKALVGAAPAARMGAPYREGIYRAEHTDATYRRLLADARYWLERGESVVLDASWTDATWRAEAERLADATSSDLVALRCVAPQELAAARLAARGGRDASDATAGIAAAMAADAAPWPESVAVDTSGTVEQSVDAAFDAVVATEGMARAG